MSISINKEKELVITCPDWVDGYSGAHCRIDSLLSMLEAANTDMISHDDIYNVCGMIRDLLPTNSQMCELQRLEQGK